MTFVRFFKSILTLGLQVALLAPAVLGQDAPLFIQGALEDATVSGDAYNAGGSITVNGFSMNVPENLLVQFPAAWVPWKTFVESKDKFLGFETLVFYSRRLVGFAELQFSNRYNRLWAIASMEFQGLAKFRSTNSLKDWRVDSLSPLTMRTEA